MTEADLIAAVKLDSAGNTSSIECDPIAEVSSIYTHASVNKGSFDMYKATL